MGTLRVLICSVAIVAAAMAPAGPAAAATPDACWMEGVLQTAQEFNYFVPVGMGGMSLTLVGVCATGAPLGITGGSVEGLCGLGQGSLMLNGRTGLFDWRGNQWTFRDGLAGSLTVEPDYASGHDCVTGASKFLLTGTLALV